MNTHIKKISIILIYMLSLSRGYSKQKVEAVNVKLLNDTLNLKFSWNNSRFVIGNYDNPVALIGVYNKVISKNDTIKDIYNAISFLSYPQLDITDFNSTSFKGFIILNMNNTAYENDEQFWEEYNLPWLKNLIKKCTTIYVLSKTDSDQLKYQFVQVSEKKAIAFRYSDIDYQLKRTGFGKELEYLDSQVKKGFYKWDEKIGAYLPVN